MDIKILKLKQITKQMAIDKLKSPDDLEFEQIDEYLDVISAVNNEQLVYNISTSNGDYILFITARESKI